MFYYYIMNFDIGISLGWNCHSAMWGVANDVRGKKGDGYNTCPFDIMVTNYVGVCECIKDDFKYMCHEDCLEMIPVNENETTIYNKKYNFVFNHESPGHADLYIHEGWPNGKDHFVINNFENLKKRYEERIRNFIEYMSSSTNFVTFIITSWKKKEEDMYLLKDILKQKYPDLKYKILILDDPNGKEYFKRHLLDMRFRENDEELSRLNNL